MTPINLERDMTWWDPNVGAHNFTSNANTATALNFNGDATVHQRVGMMFSNYLDDTASAGDSNVIGLRMLAPPEGEYVPYRFHGFADTKNRCRWYVGFETSSGVCEGFRMISSGKDIDGCVSILGQSTGDTYFGDNLVFLASVEREFASTTRVSGAVQRFIAKPPQYASASS